VPQWRGHGGGALVALALLAGCTVGPNFRRPAAPAHAGYTRKPLPQATVAAAVAGGAAQRFIPGLSIPGEWWRLFHSPALDRLVRRALAANPSLTAARAALRRAQERVLAARGALLPRVDADFSASRNKTAASLGAVPANGALYYTLYTPEVTVSYAPDVFGGTRRQVEALAARAQVRRFELEATYLALTANVVAAAIAEASLRGQIAATEDVIRIAAEQLAILKRQYALGQIAGADVAAQEAALAQAQTRLPPLRKELAQQRDRLAALIGRYPNERPRQTFALSSLTLPTELPVSLPAQLIAQRPDVRAAAARLHAASAQIGVAVAALLPQFPLTGNAGSSALTLAGLAAPGNVFWTIAGDVAQPIFRGFALRHRKRAAEAAFAEAGAQYKSTVIAAFRDVADTLHALQSDAEALRAAVASERAARTSLDIARRQLQLGQINYLGLLTAERAYARARLTLVRARAARFADTAALFEALGGGWWHRNDLAPQTAAAAASPSRGAAPAARGLIARPRTAQMWTTSPWRQRN
jgi:NodT family efflux transporter outer membrane factor (OMF) lipoprotein